MPSTLPHLGPTPAGGPVVHPKPRTPDPFVNARLTSLGPDATGSERFWISCINEIEGTTSYLIDERGEYSTYHWPTGGGRRTLYAVAQADADTIWLAGGATDHLIRLSLSTGQWQTFPREAGRFVTAGMPYDPDTGKLLCGAQTALMSFDTCAGKTVRIYQGDNKPPDNFQFDPWRNADGTYSMLMVQAALSVVRWDPREETLTWQRLTDDPQHPAVRNARRTGYVRDGQAYVPYFGWIDGLSSAVTPHEHPPDAEACWFASRGDVVFGLHDDALDGVTTIVRWDAATGDTRDLASAPDTPVLNVALSNSGKIVTVDLYGNFRRYDADTGALESECRIGPMGLHRCKAIVPTGDGRLLGTPFISQNCWLHDMRSGEGVDAGRAAGRLGQVDAAVRRTAGKVYLAAYDGGQLCEFDPDKPADFPHNPRIVAHHEQGNHACGLTTDGCAVWACFRPRYGDLNGLTVRYDIQTREATYNVGALSDRHVVNAMVDPANHRLVAGSSIASDCDTATPVHVRASAAILDPVTMNVTHEALAPEGVGIIENLGPLDASRWLMRAGSRLFVFHADAVELLPYGRNLPAATVRIERTDEPGTFVIQVGDGFHRWRPDAGSTEPIATQQPGFVHAWWVHGRDMTFDCRTHIGFWPDALS